MYVGTYRIIYREKGKIPWLQNVYYQYNMLKIGGAVMGNVCFVSFSILLCQFPLQHNIGISSEIPHNGVKGVEWGGV